MCGTLESNSQIRPDLRSQILKSVSDPESEKSGNTKFWWSADCLDFARSGPIIWHFRPQNSQIRVWVSDLGSGGICELLSGPLWRHLNNGQVLCRWCGVSPETIPHLLLDCTHGGITNLRRAVKLLRSRPTRPIMEKPNLEDLKQVAGFFRGIIGLLQWVLLYFDDVSIKICS